MKNETIIETLDDNQLTIDMNNDTFSLNNLITSKICRPDTTYLLSMISEEANIANFGANEIENIKLLSFRMQDLIYDAKECKVITFKDMSIARKFVKISEERRTAQLLAFTASHEMMTPLKCLVELSDVQKEVKRVDMLKHMAIIHDTAALLLFQTRANLDKDAINKNALRPILELKSIDEVVKPVISMLT